MREGKGKRELAEGCKTPEVVKGKFQSSQHKIVGNLWMPFLEKSYKTKKKREGEGVSKIRERKRKRGESGTVTTRSIQQQAEVKTIERHFENTCPLPLRILVTHTPLFFRSLPPPQIKPETEC